MAAAADIGSGETEIPPGPFARRGNTLRILRVVAPLLAAAFAFTAVLVTVDAPKARPDPVTPGTGRPSGDPGRFMAGVVKLIGENRYGRAWQTLHPAHQRVAPRAAYVSCENLTAIPGHVQSVKVVRVFDEQFQLTNVLRVPSKAVDVKITFTDSISPEPFVVLHTVHAVAVGARWTWVLPPKRFEAYRAGRCA